ncbi:MAG: hypothetical protein ACQES9_13525 [Myxococcota bacterium]
MNYCSNCKVAESEESEKCKLCGGETEALSEAEVDGETFYLANYRLSDKEIKEKLQLYLIENAAELPRDFVKEFSFKESSRLMAEMQVYLSQFEVSYQYESGVEKEEEVIDFIPGWRKVKDRFEKIQHPVKKIREKIVWNQKDKVFNGHFLLSLASNTDFPLAEDLEELVDLKHLDRCGMDLHKKLEGAGAKDDGVKLQVRKMIEQGIVNYVKREIEKELSTAMITRELEVDRPQFTTASCKLFMPFYMVLLVWRGELYRVFIDGTGKSVKGILPEDETKLKKLRQLEIEIERSNEEKDMNIKATGQMINRGVFTFFSGVFLLLINTLFFKGTFSLTSMKFSSMFLLFSLLVMAIGAAAYFYGNGQSKLMEENHSRIIADKWNKIDELVGKEKAWVEQQLAKNK